MAGRLYLSLVVMLSTCTAAHAAGRIEGRVRDEAGNGIRGVEAILDETGAVRISDRDGSVFFMRVPDGDYSITLSLGRHTRSISGIEVKRGETATVQVTVDWGPSFADEITVAASRRVERVVEAPAAVTALSEDAIARGSGSGEIPRLLDTAPGVYVVTTSGYYSEVNARGFNGFNNRRVQVYLDGVDQSVPFAGFQEWFPYNLMDLGNAELVKGASSSLYGANAFNGVLILITKRPSESQGGSVRLTVGDPAFIRADLRWAGDLSSGWFFKLVGNHQEGDYFAQARTETTEYLGLPKELFPLSDGSVKSGTYLLRFDRLFDSGPLLTLESGFQDLRGNPVAIAFPGRFTLIEPIEQVWLRLDFTSQHLEALAYYTDRQAPDFVDLTTGGHLFDDSQRRRVQVLGHDEYRRLRVVGGASYQEDEIGHSVIADPVEANSKALFGQFDYELAANVRLVVAGRWDVGTLYDGRISPRAGIVWAVNPNHTLRLTYNEGFQAPTYGDFFLDLPFFLPAPSGPIQVVDLASVEANLCSPFGVSCGFEKPTPVRLVGNEALEVEEIASIEAGYSANLGDRAFLTLDLYRNQLKDFLTQPLPDPFGTLNPRFEFYSPPPRHPEPDTLLTALQEELGPFFPFLLRDVDGSPVFIPLSFTNAGRVDTQGVDVALSYHVGDQWLFELSYSWFEFEIEDEGIAGGLFPNTPKHKAAVDITYLRPRFDVSVQYRWADGFLWGSGIFVGPVPSSGVLTGTANYTIGEQWAVGFNVTNLLDERHYEAFGGDLLGRRTLAYATFSW